MKKVISLPEFDTWYGQQPDADQQRVQREISRLARGERVVYETLTTRTHSTLAGRPEHAILEVQVGLDAGPPLQLSVDVPGDEVIVLYCLPATAQLVIVLCAGTGAGARAGLRRRARSLARQFDV